MRYTLQQQLTAQGYALVNRYFDEARRQIALITGGEAPDLSKPIRWADFSPSVRGRVEAVYTSLFRQLKALTAKTLNEADSRSAHALLQTEAIKPLGTGQHRMPELSKRIWAYVGQEKNSMELTLTRVLREKKSPSDAVHLFTKYLNLPDEMLRYLASEGDPALTQRAMQILNPGTGVYRDPVKNVLRLLKTEINRATKTADWERMQASPYITGYRIKRSGRYHTAKTQGKKQLECELCDHLTGEYPKTFKFTGWHPNCECIVEPIFASDPAERKRIRQALKAGKAYTPNGTIRDLPRGLHEVYHRLSPRNRSVVDTALKPYQIDAGIEEARNTYQAYGEDWKKAYFDELTGGYNVYHKKHQFSKQGGGGDAEKAVGLMLARQGKQIEFLPEGVVDGEKCADLRFDGKEWDVKNVNTNNQRTIRKAYKDATLKADAVIFYDQGGERKEIIEEAVLREKGDMSLHKRPVIRAYCVNSKGEWIEI